MIRFRRTKNMISEVDKNGLVIKRTKFKSINAAKRKSKEIQMAEQGRLGKGVLVTKMRESL